MDCSWWLSSYYTTVSGMENGVLLWNTVGQQVQMWQLVLWMCQIHCTFWMPPKSSYFGSVNYSWAIQKMLRAGKRRHGVVWGWYQCKQTFTFMLSIFALSDMPQFLDLCSQTTDIVPKRPVGDQAVYKEVKFYLPSACTPHPHSMQCVLLVQYYGLCAMDMQSIGLDHNCIGTIWSCEG